MKPMKYDKTKTYEYFKDIVSKLDKKFESAGEQGAAAA